MLLTNATNTLSGTVSAGSLVAGATGAFGTAAITLGDANTNSNGSSPTLAISGNYTASNAITIANQTTTGTYTIAGLAAANATFSGGITLNQNLAFAQASGGTLNINGLIAGSLAVSVSSGLVVFNNGGNTYTGGTTVNGGTLDLTGGGNGQPGCIRGTLTIQPGATAIAQALASNPSDNGVLGNSATPAQNVTTININNGALLNNSANTNGNQVITGATITLTGGTLGTINGLALDFL